MARAEDRSTAARVWFTADSHFGHGGAIGRFKRPFKSVLEMDAALVARWNEVVGPEDRVWHLGDFAYRATRDRVSSLLQQLHGEKHLITGNNDGEATIAVAEWAGVTPYQEIVCEGVHVIMCHYPFRTWDRMYKGAYNLHGHSHGKLKPLPRQVDVGVDVWDFRPVDIHSITSSRAILRDAAKRR